MKVLCPTDFSKAAAEAADVAAAIAAKCDCPLQLLYCITDSSAPVDFPIENPMDQEAPKLLKKEAGRIEASGVSASTLLSRGVADREIVAAGSGDTKLIVTASTGRGMAQRWLIGSVAERVAESAHVPTLIVRQPKPLLEWLGGKRPLRVLCAVDFTISADAAVAAVRELASLGPVEVEAAYITNKDSCRAEASAQNEELMDDEMLDLERDVWERLHEVLEAVPVTVHVRRREEGCDFDFVRLADERKADLLVLGTHQRHGLERLSAPSFSRGVLHHAATNVLCVPLSSYHPEFHVPTIRRVLVAADLTEADATTVRYACSLLPMGGSVQLLHVIQIPTPGLEGIVPAEIYASSSANASEAIAASEEKLRNLVPRSLSSAVITTTVRAVRQANVGAAISENAEGFGADIVCMGSGGHSSVSTTLLGSVLRDVMARTRRPVLVVPPPLR